METGIKQLHGGDVRQFPWLEAMVAALDDRLRLSHGVMEYTNSSEAQLRTDHAPATILFATSAVGSIECRYFTPTEQDGILVVPVRDRQLQRSPACQRFFKCARAPG